MADDDLEAIWGREASASAAPSARPAMADWSPPAPRHETESETEIGPPPGRRGRVVVGLAVALVALVVAAVVALGGDDDGEDDDTAAERRSGTTTTLAESMSEIATTKATVPSATEAPVVPPTWTASVVCGDGCALATDDERAYVVVTSPSGERVRALDVGRGQVRWEHGFSEGVGEVRRMPSVVVVTQVGARPATGASPGDVGRTVALDPTTGEELWARPGLLTEAVGRDHLILDRPSGSPEAPLATMTVVEAATGREVLTRTALSTELFLHGCGDAGLVLAAGGERLTALDVVDGTERWSIAAPHLDAFVPVRCDLTRVAFLEGDTLRLLDIDSGEEIASRVVVFDVEKPVEVLAVTGGVVVVGSVDGVNVYDATGLQPGWLSRCAACGPDLPVGSIEDHVAVVMGGEVVVQSLADEEPEPRRLRLAGLTEKELTDGTLLAWDAARVVAVRVDGLDRVVQAEVADVRTTAAGSSHVVVATGDEVRVYPLASEG